MRYRAAADCTDFDGRFYKKGEVVELGGELHSAFLEPVEEAAEPETPKAETEKKKPRAAKAEA